MTSFAHRFKELRERKGWTQDEAAAALGVSRSAIAGYESESKNRTPRKEVMDKIADVFVVSTDYLLGRTDDLSTTTTTVAGQEISISPEELRILEEIRKHPVMFHELAKNPEKNVKDLIKMWKFIKQDMFNEDDEEYFDEEIIED